MVAAVEQGDVARGSELQNRIWIDGPFRQSEHVAAGIWERAAEMNRIALARGTWKADLAPLQPLAPPAAQRLREVHVPTLIVAGALDHPDILRAADFLAAEISAEQSHRTLPNNASEAFVYCCFNMIVVVLIQRGQSFVELSLRQRSTY